MTYVPELTSLVLIQLFLLTSILTSFTQWHYQSLLGKIVRMSLYSRMYFTKFHQGPIIESINYVAYFTRIIVTHQLHLIHLNHLSSLGDIAKHKHSYYSVEEYLSGTLKVSLTTTQYK